MDHLEPYTPDSLTWWTEQVAASPRAERTLEERIADARAAMPKRRRLPIYGDGPNGMAVRAAMDDWGYGDWFENASLSSEGDEHAAMTIDCCVALGSMSVNELDRFFAEYLANSNDADVAAAREVHDDFKNAWVSRCVYETTGSVERTAHGEHACGEVPPPALKAPVRGGVYAFGISGWIKIGRAKNIAKRLQALQTGHPEPIRYLGILSTSMDDEPRLHAQWAHLRGSGEWFRAEPELMDFIRDKTGFGP